MVLKKMNNQITSYTCTKNHAVITDNESGEIICSNCGVVISERIVDYEHQESRAFTIETLGNGSRTGSPRSLAVHNMGLSTIIGRENRDASGQQLKASVRSSIERLRTWDSRLQVSSSSSENRGLRDAFYLLERLKDKLGLTEALVEKTAYIYRKAHERRIVRGRTVLGILAAAIYIACREMGSPITIRDVAERCNIDRRDVARNYRVLVFELEIKSPAIDPMKCIAKIANKSSISEKTKRGAIEMMEKVIREELSAGKDPMGLAATVLYMSSRKSGENRTQSELAKASGVTEVTIRNRFNHLKYMLDVELN